MKEIGKQYLTINCIKDLPADESGKILNGLLMLFAFSIFLLGGKNIRSLKKKKRFRTSSYLFLFYFFAQLTTLCKRII